MSSLFLKGRHLLVITVTAGPPPGLRLARACHGSRQLKVTATRSAYHDGQQWQSESEPVTSPGCLHRLHSGCGNRWRCHGDKRLTVSLTTLWSDSCTFGPARIPSRRRADGVTRHRLESLTSRCVARLHRVARGLCRSMVAQAVSAGPAAIPQTSHTPDSRLQGGIKFLYLISCGYLENVNHSIVWHPMELRVLRELRRLKPDLNKSCVYWCLRSFCLNGFYKHQ